MSYQTVLFEVRDAVAVLTLHRPEKLNSLNDRLMTEVRDVLRRVAEDPELRVLVITGAGRGFCAGADLADSESSGTAPGRDSLSVGDRVAERMLEQFNPFVREVYRLDKPVIAAVNGVVAGGGVGLVLACDMVIAARSARFTLVFAPKLGIVPDLGSTWALPRLVGRARAMGLALLGDSLTAERAAEWGLIWKCVDDEALMEEAMATAQRLAESPPKVFGYLKRAFRESERNTLEQQLEFERVCQGILCDTEDFLKGVAAFMAKRGTQAKK